MINPFKEVNWKPRRRDLRSFGVSLAIGFPIVAVLILVVRRLVTGTWHFETSCWVGGAGLGLGLVFLLIPSLGRPFYLTWYFLGCCVGIVVSNLLLSLFYFTLVTGTGLVMRALGKLSFTKHPDKSLPTYWQDAPRITDMKRYYRQF